MIVEREEYTLTCDRCGNKYYTNCAYLNSKDKSVPRQYIDIECGICGAHLTDAGNGKYEKVLCFVNDDEDTEKSKYFSEFKMGEVIDSEKYPALVFSLCDCPQCRFINSFGKILHVPIAKVTAEGISKIMTDDEAPVLAECPQCKKICDIFFMSSKGKERLYS